MAGLKFIRRVFDRPYKKFNVLLLMLLSLWLGYELANYESKSLRNSISVQTETINALNNNNEEFIRQYNQSFAQQSLCKFELDTSRDTLIELTRTASQCEQQVAFYQYVVAPELSGNLLSVDLISVKPEQISLGRYQLDLVLLQPRLRKRVITGDLHIYIVYSDTELPIPLVDLAYQFKFFQQLSTTIKLPDDRTPKYLLFKSKVFQYKRFREEFSMKYQWSLD